MSFQGFYTTKGLSLAAKIAAGTKLTITKVTAGSGETAKSATALAGEKQTLTAGAATINGESAVLPVTLAEVNVSSPYSLTELGVYAQDPDAGEILFQIFRMDKPVILTAGGMNTYRFYLKQTMGAAGITVTCSPAGLLIDEDLQPLRAELAKKPDAWMTDLVLHVAKTGSDTTGDGSEAKPYLTIQKALNSLPRLLLCRVYIRIHAGSYPEQVTINRFFSMESLILEGASGESVQVGAINAIVCGCILQIANLELTGTSGDNYNTSLSCDRVQELEIRNVTCTGTVASAYLGAFRLDKCRLVRIQNTVISNKPVALDVYSSMVYLNDTVTGENNTVGIRCGSAWGNHGGYVQKGGAAIAGEEQKGFGGQIW